MPVDETVGMEGEFKVGEPATLLIPFHAYPGPTRYRVFCFKPVSSYIIVYVLFMEQKRIVKTLIWINDKRRSNILSSIEVFHF